MATFNTDVAIVTFTTIGCAPTTYNLYLQLKKFNLHTLLSIYCYDEDTVKYFKNQKIDCEIILFQPVLPNINLERSLVDKYNEFLKPGIHDTYSVVVSLKFDAVFQALKKRDKRFILLMDNDIIIFDNFIPNIIELMLNPSKHHREGTIADMAVKYYLQWNKDICSNQEIIGIKPCVNTGFICFHNTLIVENFIKDQLYPTIASIVPSAKVMNIDELVFTNTIEKKRDLSLVVIPDYIHMLSDISYKHTVSTLKNRLSKITKSYHATFTEDKPGFIRNAGYWLLNELNK